MDDEWIEAFMDKFENFKNNLMNDLRDLFVHRKKQEIEKVRPKQEKYWIVKRELKIDPKSDFGRKMKKICPASELGGMNQKQNKKKQPGYSSKFELEWKMLKLCQDISRTKKSINTGRIIENWLQCDVVRLKRNYPID